MAIQLYTGPPPYRTRADDHPTLLVTYWTSACCLVMILWRLIGRLVRMNELYTDDKMMAVTIVPLVARQALVHLVLVWGTNNVLLGEEVSEDEIRRRELGSKAVMGARVAYAAFVWSQKLCITEFYTKMTNPFWESWQNSALKWFKVYLAGSFIATLIALFAECQPFNDNFQVLPDPGPHCRQAVSVLLTHTTQMFLIDAFLALFPLPIILYSRLSTTRKLCLMFCLSASFLPVLLGAFKIPTVIGQGSPQHLRTLFASFEGLASCAIANLVVLLSFVRDTAPKRQKFRTDSDAEKSLRPRGHGSFASPTGTNLPPLPSPHPHQNSKRFSGTSTDVTGSRSTDWWSQHDDLTTDDETELSTDPLTQDANSPLRLALPTPLSPPHHHSRSPTSIGPPSPGTLGPGQVAPPTTQHYRRWSGGGGAVVSSFMPVPGVGYGYAPPAGGGGYAEFERAHGGWGRSK